MSRGQTNIAHGTPRRAEHPSHLGTPRAIRSTHPRNETTRARTVKLEELLPDATIRGILPNESVTVVKVEMHGSDALTLVYRRPNGAVDQEILYRHDEPRLEIV